MVARCVRVFHPITAPNILKPPYIVQKVLPNPPFPFYELDKLPDELQYKKGSNLLPPKYHLGWIIDEEAFLIWAERLNALEYVQTADDEDPMLKEFGEGWSDSDDDDKSEQKSVVQQPNSATQERSGIRAVGRRGVGRSRFPQEAADIMLREFTSFPPIPAPAA